MRTETRASRLADLELEHKKEVVGPIRQKLEAFARQELKDHPEALGRVAGIEVHHGHPTAEILKAADRLEADLVVMGSHGKGTLHYAFLGSVAEKVLRKSLRPVLVAPLVD